MHGENEAEGSRDNVDSKSSKRGRDHRITTQQRSGSERLRKKLTLSDSSFQPSLVFGVDTGMKSIPSNTSGFVPASHEDPRNSSALKRVIATRDDLQAGQVREW